MNNNAQTEAAQIIRAKLNAHGFKLYGLPEMKKQEQLYILRYLQNNEFNADEMNGVAKLFECKLWTNEE